MADPFLGEVRMFGGNFAPVGLGVLQRPAASDRPVRRAVHPASARPTAATGRPRSRLPNLISRMPVGAGSSHMLGQFAGEENVTLTSAQLPPHTHQVNASDNAATDTSPAGNVWANWAEAQYSSGAPNTAMDPSGVSLAGQSLPHDNRAPYLGISFIIALEGIFPSQN